MVKLETVIEIVKQEFQRKPQFIDSNIACIKRGAELALQALEATK
jgi:Pyruvate/2-oxoacid:ferredoxin oxidoreductase gamma subunit